MTEKKAADPASTQVFDAISGVMKKLGSEGIAKARRNRDQGYQFRGIDDVLNALNGFLTEERLIILPRYADRSVDARPTKSGGVMFNVTVWGEFDFICTKDASRCVAGPFPGEAQDSADKATNKAMSAAYKNMAIQVFCIPTEGDNDADAQTPEDTAAVVEGQEKAPRPTLSDLAAYEQFVSQLEKAKTDRVLNTVWKAHVDALKAWYDSNNGLYEKIYEVARQQRQAIKKGNLPEHGEDDGMRPPD